MNIVIDKIMAKLLEGGFAKPENADIIRFGLELATMRALISTAVVIVAFALNSAPAVVAFMAVYQPLRSCCGGYHAKTRTLCFISSLLLMITVIVTIKLFIGTICLILSLCFIISGLGIIFFLAPVDTPSKPFDDKERIIFRKRSLIAAMLSITAANVFMIFGMDSLLLSVSMAFFFTGLLLILGRLSKKKGTIV